MVLESLRQLSVLEEVHVRASRALSSGDVKACAAALAVLARLGGPVFGFEVPSRPDDAARWQPIIERTFCALEERAKHANGMRARLNAHLADPRPWDEAWRTDVARTLFIHERHERHWKVAVAIAQASIEASTA
jgi:hypothetical protein